MREAAAGSRRWEEFRLLAPPAGPLPDPTPGDGPDPYGNPDPDWLRIDWRPHLQTARVEGVPVNYVELGSGPGPAVVLVHGLSGSWQNWLENIPRLAASRRVVAPDLPGFGASPLPPWEPTIEAYGRFLHDFCRAVEVTDCVVVGNSMGGFIAAEAASRAPERFERLVLVSAAGVSHSRMSGEPAELVARMVVAAGPLALRLQERALRRPRMRRLAFGGLVHDPLALRPELLWEFLHNGAGRPGFLPALQRLFGYDILERLEGVLVPALIVWGRQDRIVPAGDAAGYAERLPNSRVEIFDRCGHLPMAERPVRFNRELEAFLAET